MTAHTLPAPLLAAPHAAPARARTYLGVRLRLAFALILALQLATALLVVRTASGAAAHGALACSVLALAVTGFLAGWLLQRIVRPLGPATAAMDRISTGDLSVAISAENSGELRPLMEAMLRTREHLVDIVGQVRTGMVNVATHAIQINRDNGALAQRTETQAVSVQETAASMEQLTAAVRQNAETAQRAHALARSASDQAEQGAGVMRDVVQTMDSIRASSHSIREIIGVIDGIAFQTNILALNAAVEAARAGEQGRGFAVVAGEVRTLAQRCGEAAREIRTLIGGSVQKVDAGGLRVDEAGRAVQEIVAAVRQVADLIGHMDASSREQSSGIETVNDAIARIDGTTQDNAAFVRGASRTAAALQDRAVMVSRAVGRFTLGASEHADAQDAVALVEQGCAFLRQHGREAFAAEVNKLDAGRFIDRDLYLMGLDLRDAVFVAHGHLPNRLGTGPDVRDVDGKYFPREIVRLARERGEGWVDYKWVHPVTQEVFQKSGYVRREGDLAVYAAIYKN